MLLSAGETVSSARAAMILVHGRDASARDILLTTQQLERSGFAFLAPEAPGGEWYPQPLEFAARNPRRYGGIIGWSGALIGADGAQAERNGSLDATPVLLGCSDVDPYIGEPRVRDAAAVLEGMGARVDLQIYPGMGHEVNMDEINRVQQLMADVIRAEKEVA